jgi:hypothetical protein
MKSRQSEEGVDLTVVRDFDIMSVSEPSKDLLRAIATIEDTSERQAVVELIPTSKTVDELMRNISMLKVGK